MTRRCGVCVLQPIPSIEPSVGFSNHNHISALGRLVVLRELKIMRGEPRKATWYHGALGRVGLDTYSGVELAPNGC